MRKNSKFEARNPKHEGMPESRNSKREENWKSETRNQKQTTMPNRIEGSKRFDLEERTYQFAKDVRAFVKALPRTIANEQDIRQLVRASGSVGANYIEANESLSKKDFVMHIRISRKEAKESRYWLRLVDTGENSSLDKTREALIKEATELMNVFGAIMRKSE